MTSSTSSSDRPEPWRGVFVLAIGIAAAFAALLYGFVVVVDPLDTLALSPRLDRAPVSTNARFSFPALARSAKFDSAIIGTSTSRLLRPVDLDPAFGARFANLAMNDARAYEEYRLLQVFARHHPEARVVMIGLDAVWCGTGETYEKYTARPFPEWMYAEAPWRAYREMFNYFAVERAVRQFAIVTGLRKTRYGRDGYTNFLPDESRYDLARAQAHLRPPGVRPAEPGKPVDPAALNFPTHPLLAEALSGLSSATRKILFFVPYHADAQPAPGSAAGVTFAECKRRVTQIAAAATNTIVVDFMIPSPITREDSHYWDPLHYRVAIAERMARDLAAAARRVEAADGDYRLLTP